MWSTRCIAVAAASSSARCVRVTAAGAASRPFLVRCPALPVAAAAASSSYCTVAPIESLYRGRLAAVTAAASSSCRRALHSGAAAGSVVRAPSLASASSGPSPSVLSPLPTAPSFDAPLPTLQAPDKIDPSELIIDESAVKRLRTLSHQFGHPVSLRVLVDQGGCSGLEYKFAIEHGAAPEDEDIDITVGGQRVWVDRDSWLWLRGSRIEYQQELARSAFVVSANPNATQACGCKSSFAPKIDPRVATTPAATPKPAL